MKPSDGSWIVVDGGLKQIDGGEKYVYGVNSNDDVYTRNVDGPGSWRHILCRQALTHLSLGIWREISFRDSATRIWRRVVGY